MFRKTLLIFSFSLLLFGCQNAQENQIAPAEPVACTEEAKVCPDGSAVGRSGPDCEFDPCPAPLTTPIMSSDEISFNNLPTDDCISPTSSQQYPAQTACPGLGATITKITTNHGEIWIQLFPEKTPKTVENFVGLAKKGYYDGIIFHRVIPEFMIQGGDPLGLGTGGESLWGSDFEDEFVDDLSNLRGALSMANRGPGTNGSQFFIVQKEDGTDWLDGKHTVFGQVISGMKVVDEIADVKTTINDKPAEDVVMDKVEVFEVVE